MRRAIRRSVSHLVLVVTAAHGGFIARARQIVAERGTPEQQACAPALGGRARTREEAMRHYYEVMGPLYSRRHDPTAAEAGRPRIDAFAGAR